MSALWTSLPFFTWYHVIVLAVRSLLPARDMIRTSRLGEVEHPVAYAGSPTIAIVGYRQRRGSARIVGSYRVYAGILEFLQHFSPGRHPSISDVAVSAIEAFFGGFAAAPLARRVLKGAHSDIA
jgi:VanZ family protein